MRILHVIDSLRLAGAERLVVDLATAMHRAGHETHIYAARKDPDHLSVRPVDGVPVFFSGVRRLYSPAQVPALAAHLRRLDYDIVHVHLYPAQLWAVAAACLARTRAHLVTTEHNTTNRRRSCRPLRLLDAQMYARYERICAISQATAEHLLDYLPALGGRVAVIPNGIVLDRFTRPATGSARSELQVVSVGRCEPQKRHDLTIRAVAMTPGVSLAVVGDGPGRRDLERLTQELGVATRVKFLGHRSDVASLLSGADLYVQASGYEGFGIAAVEAMASGLPVVYSDVPGLRDVVGTAGLPFATGSPSALADALGRLIREPALRRSLAQTSLLRAQQFSLERCVRSYLGLYTEACGEGLGEALAA